MKDEEEDDEEEDEKEEDEEISLVRSTSSFLLPPSSFNTPPSSFKAGGTHPGPGVLSTVSEIAVFTLAMSR